jgi:hypothetical protein
MPSGRFGPLGDSWVRGCGDDRTHETNHLHSKIPTRQQITQTTNQTNNKRINEATTPSTQKSMAIPFSRKTRDPITTHNRRSNQDALISWPQGR